MECALYSSSSISRVGCLLHRKDEEYTVYSIARRKGGVHHLLLLSPLRWIKCHTSCPLAHDGGRGVGRILHCEEERRIKLCTSLYASFPLHNGASSSSILHIGFILHHKDDEYAAYISPSRGGEEDYTTYLYSSSPPHDGVRWLLLVQMRIRIRTPTPSQGGKEVYSWLSVADVPQRGEGLAPTR